MKKKSILLFLTLAICLSACTFHPPDGWTKRHHSYKEVLAYAKSIDPNATVAKEYTNTLDEYGWEYREWNAVINGIDCHVSSVSDRVWNDGLAAGEFVKMYYRLDTDYDYLVMQSILSEKYPGWIMSDGIYSRYHNSTLYIKLSLPEFRMLNTDELELVWKAASDINAEYKSLVIDREAGFCIPSPAKYTNPYKQESYVKRDSYAYITSFTEEGKNQFLQEYRDDWALLDSGLPVYN